MARTAQIAIKIRNNGVPLGSIGFTTIDLTGTLSGSDEGSGVVDILGSGGTGTNVATETVASVQSGNDVTLDLTTLLHPFVAVEVVFRNGQALTPISSWSLVGSQVTVFNADTTDVFLVQYTF